jgi:hypothetical protein
MPAKRTLEVLLPSPQAVLRKTDAKPQPKIWSVELLTLPRGHERGRPFAFRNEFRLGGSVRSRVHRLSLSEGGEPHRYPVMTFDLASRLPMTASSRSMYQCPRITGRDTPFGHLISSLIRIKSITSRFAVSRQMQTTSSAPCRKAFRFLQGSLLNSSAGERRPRRKRQAGMLRPTIKAVIDGSSFAGMINDGMAELRTEFCVLIASERR